MTRRNRDPIEAKVQETYRYFYADGLVEAGIGLMFVTVGLVLVSWLAFEETPWLRVLSALALPLFTFVGALLLKRTVRQIKKQVTYPRTGYVAYRPGEPSAGRWLILAAVFLLVALSVAFPALMEMPATIGGLLAILLTYLGYRVNLWRFYLFALVALFAGLALTALVAEELLAAALTFVVVGTVVLLVGLAVFVTYLQRHPRREEESRA